MSTSPGPRPALRRPVSPATLERSARKLKLTEERLGVVRIDGARHSLLWTYNEGRSISVLLDRPEQGSEKLVRLLGAFWPEEDFEAVEALAADYEEHHVNCPRVERIPPRALEPADLAPPPGAGARVRARGGRPHRPKEKQ